MNPSFFDPHVQLERRDEHDLRNLLYFGVAQVVVCAHAITSSSPHAHVNHWHDLLTLRLRELRDLGFGRCGVALALSPSRSLDVSMIHRAEVWAQLDDLCANHPDDVLGLGSLVLSEDTTQTWDVFNAHLELLVKHPHLRAVIVIAATHPKTILFEALRQLSMYPIDPRRVVFDGLGPEALPSLMAHDGYHAVLSAGSHGFEREDMVNYALHVAHNEPQHLERLMFGSGCYNGCFDILGLPKFEQDLRRLEVDEALIAALTREHARAFWFGQR